MRISRISAENDKALKLRRDGQTVYNRQQLRYLAIISRRLVPLNEKWGKSGFELIYQLRRDCGIIHGVASLVCVRTSHYSEDHSGGRHLFASPSGSGMAKVALGAGVPRQTPPIHFCKIPSPMTKGAYIVSHFWGRVHDYPPKKKSFSPCPSKRFLLCFRP